MGTDTEHETYCASEVSPKQDSPLKSNIGTITTTRSKSEDCESEHYENEDSSELISKTAPPRAADLLVIGNFDEHLPSTVSFLQTPEGAKVYLVGTVHFSTESQDDVSTVIRNVRPDIVVVELCGNRDFLLLLDEETIKRDAENMTLENILATIRENGMLCGLMYILFFRLSTRLSKSVGTFPGGEFRRAYSEVKMLRQNCKIYLGDRPIDVTFQRFLSFLTWWKCIKLFFGLVFCKPHISKEEMENYKEKNFLEKLLKEFSGNFPELWRGLFEERDIYLTYSLQLATQEQPERLAPGPPEPIRVVGIVGIGHVPGITKLWGTVKESDITSIMTIPPPSKFSHVIKVTIKLAVVGIALLGAYYLFAPTVASLVNQVELYDMFTKQ